VLEFSDCPLIERVSQEILVWVSDDVLFVDPKFELDSEIFLASFLCFRDAFDVDSSVGPEAEEGCSFVVTWYGISAWSLVVLPP
jgi:hypothetical protein